MTAVHVVIYIQDSESTLLVAFEGPPTGDQLRAAWRTKYPEADRYDFRVDAEGGVSVFEGERLLGDRFWVEIHKDVSVVDLPAP